MGGNAGGVNDRVLDPYGGFNFRVEIEGVQAGAFQEVDGIGVDVDVIELQDGTDLTPRKRPGRKKVRDVRLKKGFVAKNTMFQWMKEVMEGKLTRKSISIVLHGDNGEAVLRFNYFEAWPKSWGGVRFDGNRQALQIEEIEFTSEKMEVESN